MGVVAIRMGVSCHRLSSFVFATVSIDFFKDISICFAPSECDQVTRAVLQTYAPSESDRIVALCAMCLLPVHARTIRYCIYEKEVLQAKMDELVALIEKTW